jgi:hypothetical protein
MTGSLRPAGAIGAFRSIPRVPASGSRRAMQLQMLAQPPDGRINWLLHY